MSTASSYTVFTTTHDPSPDDGDGDEWTPRGALHDEVAALRTSKREKLPPFKPGESLSDPFAGIGTPASKVYVLGTLERQTLKAHWDGTRETARAIGEELGGIPAWKIVAWARELELPKAAHIIADVVSKSTLADDEKTIVLATYVNPAPTEPVSGEGETPSSPGPQEPTLTQAPYKGRRGKRIPDEVRSQVIALRESGVSQHEVARRLQVSGSTIYALMAAHRAGRPSVSATPAREPQSQPQPTPEQQPHEGTPPAIPSEPLVQTIARSTGSATDEAHDAHESEAANHAANYAVLLDLMEFLPRDGRWASANQRYRWETAFSACLAVVTTVGDGDGERKQVAQ